MLYVLTLHTFYSSRNHCLVFSHDENSEGYSACNVKLGDCQNSYFHTDQSINTPESICPWTPYLCNYSYDGINGRFSDGDNNAQTVLIENKIKPKNMQGWFWWGMKLTSFQGLNNIDTSQVTSMAETFCYCVRTPSLDLSSWDTSNVNSMKEMFNYCISLQSVNYGDKFIKKEGCSTSSMFTQCRANKPSWW